MSFINRALFFLVMSISFIGAIPPPDNSSPDSVTVKDDIVTKMSNVDDIGLVLVWNGDGASTVAQCEWTSGGNHGHDRTNISKYLTKGTNYIIYVLYNKVYQGGIFFAGGKWSYDFSLSKNGSTVWSASDYQRENDAEIKYWKVIEADVSSSGRVSLTDSIPSKNLKKLREALSELEGKLYNGTGVATPF